MRLSLSSRSSAVLLSLALFCFGFVLQTSAQDTTASLQGTVSDPSGAQVADAKVTVVNRGTGESQVGTTNSEGVFSFTRLPVGEYNLAVEMSGFDRYQQSGLQLNVGQAAVANVALRLGNVGTEVEVSANVGLVDTRTFTSNQLIEEKQVTDLPLNGRNAQSLLNLSAGTVDLARNGCVICGQGGVYPNEETASVNGSADTQINYQMDGVSHNDTYVNASLPFPNPDAIQEFALQSSNFSAEYGNASGGVVNIVSKSGTNAFHGSAFEYLRNGSLNAKNYFGTTHDTLHRNQYGGAVGGPILRNKLFFFGTYQGTPVSSASAAMTSFVPTQAERSGDFSAVSTKLKDPVSGVPLQNNQIPQERLDPVSQALLKYVPLPTGANGLLTYTGVVIKTMDSQALAKIDYSIGKNQFSGHYFFTQFTEPAVLPTTNVLAAPSTGNHVRVQTVAVNHTYLSSSTLLFNTTFGLNLQHGGSTSGAPFSWADLGAKLAHPTPPELSMSVTSGFSISTNHLGEFDRGDYTIREDVTKILGPHELHMGGQVLRVMNSIDNTYRQSGSFTFNGQLSGNGLADFMFGRAYSFTQGGGEFKSFAGTQYGFFVQDNWRVNSSLTLNAGLRWDPWIPYYDHDGRVVCFIPGEQSVRYPNAPQGLVYGGTHHDAGCPTAGSSPYWPQLGPRLGFAYRVTADGNTSVRGGFGLYYTPPQTSTYNAQVDTAPFSPAFTYNSVQFSDPYGSVGVSNPFPAQYGPTLPGPSATFTLPTSVSGVFQPGWRPPATSAWNLIVERQVGKTSVARVAYIGNVSSHNSVSYPLNHAIYVPGASTTANTQNRRAYSNFSTVGENESGSSSNFNAFQVSFEKRIRVGLTVLANYTWSKSLDNFAWDDPYNHGLDYGRSTADLAHNFKFSDVWDLPIPHSKSNFLNKITEGWRANSIVVAQSGFPLTVLSGVDNSFTGIGADHAQYLGGSFNLSNGRSHAAKRAEWFNTAQFVTNPVGTFGNAAKGQLRAPRYFDTDVALLKNTQVFEKVTLQIRGEAFNVFNNVNFQAPNVTQSSAQFGVISAADDPRILQLSGKVIF
jgi:Carboxypeptidase regulatory-like domain